MSKYETRMDKAVKSARSEVKKLKAAAPYLFPEWQELENAKVALGQATKRLARAEAAWKAIGHGSKPLADGETQQ